ncbi:MAG: Hpt domain-containing protein [Alphaproteobacteria bacterium]
MPDSQAQATTGRRSVNGQTIPSDPEAALRAAEAEVSALGGAFLTQAEAEIRYIRDLAIAARTKRAPDDATNRMFTIAHNLKGQGGTFDYPLLSQIAASLCDLLNQHTAERGRVLTIVDHHVAALDIIVQRRLSGSGGALGTQLVNRLRALNATA